MGKVITTRRLEGEVEQAQNYVRSHILFPAGLLGLLLMVVGVVALIYQLIVGTYDVHTFAQSSGLLVAGVILGWTQTAYHKYILREHPAFFASRKKGYSQRGSYRLKKKLPDVSLEHRGRNLVPFLYLAGIVLLLGLSGLSVSTGSLDYMAAFALPWAGFFWAKMFSWRELARAAVHKRK